MRSTTPSTASPPADLNWISPVDAVPRQSSTSTHPARRLPKPSWPVRQLGGSPKRNRKPHGIDGDNQARLKSPGRAVRAPASRRRDAPAQPCRSPPIAADQAACSRDRPQGRRWSNQVLTERRRPACPGRAVRAGAPRRPVSLFGRVAPSRRSGCLRSGLPWQTTNSRGRCAGGDGLVPGCLDRPRSQPPSRYVREWSG